MPSAPRTTLRNILPLIQQQVADWLEWDISRVIITVLPPRDVPHTMAEQDVLLYVKSESVDSGAFEGGGRNSHIRTRRLQVVMRSRVALDIAAQFPIHLTDDSLGHISLEDQVVDALSGWLVCDADENILTLALRPGEVSEPQADPVDNTWVSSTFGVEFEYVRDHSDPLDVFPPDRPVEP